MRVLVSGGGTAGHINPALAIADKIKTEIPDAVIEYVGTPGGMENQLVPKAGYKIHGVEVKGFKRKLTIENVDAAIKAFTSVTKAKKIIKNFKPDIVIGTGGYVSWPVVKAAAKSGVPTLIHEQNAVPGVTTKMLSKLVDKVMISFENSAEFFDCDKSKLVLTGNPVSEKMLKADKKQMRQMLGIPDNAVVIVSAGGSLGAKMLNAAVFELIKNYSCEEEKVYHFHATGKGGYEEQSKLYKSIGFENVDEDTLKKGNVTVKKYIYNMNELLASADIVVCRAGAMTLSEIAAMQKASVIIPSPNVTNNHQYKNAKVLADADATLMIEEKELDDASFANALNSLVASKEKREELSKNIAQFANTDANKVIFEQIMELIKK